MKVILASKSPRRKELLDLMKLKYEVIVSNVDETFEDGLSIIEQSKRLGYIKAKAVFNITENNRIVIGSDTMVLSNNKVYEKPKDRQDAIRMLNELKNSKVEVITSLSVLIQEEEEYKEFIDYDIAEIYISNMNEEQINTYVDNGNPYDKAGAFAPHSEFCVFTDKIIGNYTTAMGLPTHKLYNIIYPYLKKREE